MATKLDISPDTIQLEAEALRGEEQSDRIDVVVDSSKIVRCKWCGTSESEKWLRTRLGLFCSVGCSYADSTEQFVPQALCLSIIMPLFIMMVIPRIVGTVGFDIVVMLSIFVGLMSLYSGMRGMDYRRSVPKDSRRNEVHLGTALLRTVSTSVVCPRCDANLDLRNIGEDRVYVCGYCGATGTIEIIDKSGQR